MTKAILYREDGSQNTTEIDDPRMISRLEFDYALETWLVGPVSGLLAVRAKTIASLNEILKQASTGARVEVLYKTQDTGRELKEILKVHRLGRILQPSLVSGDQPRLKDSDIVHLLSAGNGSFLTVTYRIITPHAAFRLPPVARTGLVDHTLIPARTATA